MQVTQRGRGEEQGGSVQRELCQAWEREEDHSVCAERIQWKRARKSVQVGRDDGKNSETDVVQVCVGSGGGVCGVAVSARGGEKQMADAAVCRLALLQEVCEGPHLGHSTQSDAVQLHGEDEFAEVARCKRDGAACRPSVCACHPDDACPELGRTSIHARNVLKLEDWRDGECQPHTESEYAAYRNQYPGGLW